MTWVFLIVGLAATFAIAAAFVGSEAFRLGHEVPAAIFDLDEAVDTVADRLPEGTQARLTYDEVRSLIRAALDHLHGAGLTAMPGEDLVPPTDDVVIDDDHALASVLAAVEIEDIDVSDDDAAVVVSRLLDHLAEIGALGPRAS